MTNGNGTLPNPCGIIEHCTFLAYSESVAMSDTSSLAHTSCDEDRFAVQSARTTCQTCFSFKIASILADQYRNLSCGPQNLDMDTIRSFIIALLRK